MTLSGDGAAAMEALLNADRSTAATTAATAAAAATPAVAERTLDAAWRGAEALHFFLLCQQHILRRNLGFALNVAMRLMDYDDIISPVDSYSLIALTAYLAKNFSICSKAFTRLEAAEQLDAQQQQQEGGGGGGAGPALAGQLQLIDMTMELDVTSRTRSAHTNNNSRGLVLGATRLDGTTTSLQLTNPSKGVVTATQFTYPTVSLKEPRRRFADLAVKIFKQNKPEDTSVDRVKCPKCEAFNKEWAPCCVNCQQPFSVCIYTGRSIAEEDFWQCAVCHHRIIDVESDRFRNCPLCHTPMKQRLRGGRQ
ncbi:WDcontaining protein 35 [Trypanosoma grayi]|uniref:WDcontaining protein 35 n=1 Tax=Trypanosoma grayi TaxID=71804 RepID=UPI0004F4177C|nr:WDcontaining protein 35 [Trypanosoma grayi]KEG05449.1 WDcontaining protein 35 [Trypanosoma grayi]